MSVVPYKEQETGKKQQVAEMFNNISHRYDFLNHLLSLGIDIHWRKQAVKRLKDIKPQTLLDVATGTGDFAITAYRKLKPEQVIGVDISEGMLDMGRQKMKKKGLDHVIEMHLGDSEGLPFEENKFDAVIVAFGVRNFENLQQGLADMRRVLRPGGRLVVLEFSQPTRFPFKQLYHFYFRYILPIIGRLVSKDSAAYTYLPESVKAFPYGKAFTDQLEAVGFKNTSCKALTFGISSVYTGDK